ncbi:hypothetical protein FGO68_gene122 [Halteria grandinella]|uniref:Legumain n=1 Tax=Halteria grandinella TaxID=5974 RepID=A0A8J8NP91_HALGN|nr:hypothetical protein FGO68_gene122 [Halteria grandinella]
MIGRRLILTKLLLELYLCTAQVIPREFQKQQQQQTPNHWAIIVSGSKDIWNYRHQAGACHAYQLLTENGGIPKEQVIHFSFDDVSRHRENPFKGELFNKPNGPNVYEGCSIDYREKDVTPEKFIKALTGNKEMENQGNKVLKSNRESKVFIYLANHGAHGLLAFPQLDYLFADEFVEALKLMKDKGLYGEMVIYMEGSNSASIFEDLLPEDIKIYSLSAAGPKETAFATYCYPNDLVKGGEHIGTCLGDLFTANFIEDSEKSDLEKETLSMQFKKVRANSKAFQTVTQHGDTSFTNEAISNFLTNSHKSAETYPLEPPPYSLSILHQLLHPFQTPYSPELHSFNRHASAINARDTKIHYLMSRITMLRAKQNPDESDMIRLHKLSLALTMELHRRMRVDHVFEEFVAKGDRDTTTYIPPKNFKCLKRLMEVYERSCGNKMDEYELQYTNLFVQECEKLPVPSAIDALVHRLQKACGH